MAKESKKKGERREHKQPWQEKYATPEEIKRMLDSRVSLRYNEVRRRTEIHYYSRGTSIVENEQGLHLILFTIPILNRPCILILAIIIQ